MMNILEGRLSKREMSRFAGVEFSEVDKSLNRLVDMGFLRYKKINGKYKFTLYSEPVTIREFSIN